MKKISISICMLTFLLLAANSVFATHYPAPAREPVISGYANFTFLTDFVSRGLRSNNGGAFQPNVGLVYEGFKVDFWANYDIEDQIHRETDLTLAYVKSFDKLYTEVGYIYEAFGPPGTQELYASLGYTTILNPSLTVYFDIDHGSGAFLMANISHSIDLGHDMSLAIAGNASFNIHNQLYSIEDDFNGFQNGKVTATVTKTITLEGYTGHPLIITIAPMVGYSFPLSDKAKDSIKALSFQKNADDPKSSWLYGGVNIGTSF